MTTEVRLPVDDQMDDILANLARDDEDSAADAIAELTTQDRRRTLFGMMRAARTIDAEIAGYRQYLSRVQEEVDAAITPRLRRKEWLEEQIKTSAEPLLVGKSKHVDMPGAGRVQYRDYESSVRIADPDAFIKALGADERARLVEDRPHLNTNDAKKYAAEVLKTGEILPGVERVEAHREGNVSYEALILERD